MLYCNYLKSAPELPKTLIFKPYPLKAQVSDNEHVKRRKEYKSEKNEWRQRKVQKSEKEEKQAIWQRSEGKQKRNWDKGVNRDERENAETELDGERAMMIRVTEGSGPKKKQKNIKGTRRRKR